MASTISTALERAASLPALMHVHAEERPSCLAVQSAAHRGDEVESALTFYQLDQEARRIAAWLQHQAPPGARILLVYATGIRFAAAFLGCLYAARVAVPVPLPGTYRQQRRRVTAIAADAAVAAVLTETSQWPAVADWAKTEGWDTLVHFVTDAPESGDIGDPLIGTMPAIGRDTLALLQYTSGSTDEPKGVMVTHGNLLCNMQSIATGLGLVKPVRTGGWLPLYHDMGLMGHLLPGLCFGGGCVLMSADAFIRKPLRWLQLIDEHGIELSAAPNFGYERCLQERAEAQIDGLNLSRWRYACNGSEPIKPETLRAFAARFAHAGFQPDAFFPCYGMAEATLFVSGCAGRAPVALRIDATKRETNHFMPVAQDAPGPEVASSGPPCGVTLRIVDPQTHQVLPEGRIGEIWLRGSGISQGYWHKEAATQEVFHAHGADGEGPFLRTGDLGACHLGEVFVTGRIKELIIVKGRNLYPQDIEQALRDQHDELATLAGAVFSIAGTSQEDIVVCHEIRRAPWSADRLRAVAVALRATVTREFGVNPAGIVLLQSHSVLRTTSGKVRRSAMRDLFLAGTLDPLYQLLGRRLSP